MPSPSSSPAPAPIPFWLVDDPLFDRHESPYGGHPERPERLTAARRAVANCESRGLSARPTKPRDATREELVRVHDEAYLDALDQADGREGELDPDTYVGSDSVRAAKRAAGGSIALVDALLDSDVRRGLALLRPPGHHATPQTGMGFCLVNNVAIAARHAITRGLSRVAVVDWDVHHGNGTQDAFFETPEILYVSLHQFPLYPGTGAVSEVGRGDGTGYTANIPLSAGATDAVYEQSFQRIVVPMLAAFSPELVLISAGYDAHARDPLAAMRVSDEGFRAMAAELRAVADASADGRIGLMLEGGYDLRAIEASLTSSLMAVVGPPSDGAGAAPSDGSPRSPVSTRHESEIERARDALKPTWPDL